MVFLHKEDRAIVALGMDTHVRIHCAEQIEAIIEVSFMKPKSHCGICQGHCKTSRRQGKLLGYCLSSVLELS